MARSLASPRSSAHTGSPASAARWERRGWWAQLVVGVSTTLFGLALAFGLLRSPFGSAENGGGLVALLPPGTLGLTLALLGALALPLLTAYDRRSRLTTTVAVVQLTGYLLVVSTNHVITVLGYLLAAAVPLGAVVLAVLSWLRYPKARVPLTLATAAVVAWGTVTGVLRPGVVATSFGRAGRGMLAHASEMSTLR